MDGKFEKIRQRYIDELFQLFREEVRQFADSVTEQLTLKDIQQHINKLNKIQEEIARMKGYSVIGTTTVWQTRD